MKKLPFKKIHWTGNDFIMIFKKDLKQLNIELTPKLIIKMCDRHFWIWADWVILVDVVDWNYIYRMFNPDGTEAEMCGNWIRCYMKYLLSENLLQSKKVKVNTLAGEKILEIDDNLIKVDMGKPIFDLEKIWLTKNIDEIEVLDKKFKFFPVSMWNPHCVIYLKENVWNFDVQKYWSLIESNTNLFKNKVNVEFVNLKNDWEIDFRVYERGAGETLACGTGACAAVVSWIKLGFLQKNKFIKVNLKWGTLYIKWSGNPQDSVIMKGEAEEVFEGFYFVK